MITSSFRRAGSSDAPRTAGVPGVPVSGGVSNSLPGAREWMHGQRMVSTGHAVLDAMVGGGLLLGSLTGGCCRQSAHLHMAMCARCRRVASDKGVM